MFTYTIKVEKIICYLYSFILRSVLTPEVKFVYRHVVCITDDTRPLACVLLIPAWTQIALASSYPASFPGPTTSLDNICFSFFIQH